VFPTAYWNDYEEDLGLHDVADAECLWVALFISGGGGLPSIKGCFKLVG